MVCTFRKSLATFARTLVYIHRWSHGFLYNSTGILSKVLKEVTESLANKSSIGEHALLQQNSINKCKKKPAGINHLQHLTA